jgi:hypothetical protein
MRLDVQGLHHVFGASRGVEPDRPPAYTDQGTPRRLLWLGCV